MDQKQFEELLIENYEGTSPKLNEIVSSILEEKQNLASFFHLLTTTFFTTTNQLARKSSMILLTNILYKQTDVIDSFDEKWRETFLDNLVTMYKNDSFFILDEKNRNPTENGIFPFDNEFMYLLSQLFASFIFATKSQIDPLYALIGNELETLETPDPLTFQYLKNLTFRLSILYSLLQRIDFSFQDLTYNYSTIILVLHKSLQAYQYNFDLALRSIFILASFLDFFPEEEENVEEDIKIILEIADKSVELEPNKFFALWGNLTALFHSEFAQTNQNFVLRFHPTIFKLCDMPTIPADMKLILIRAIWSISETYDREILHGICRLSLKLEREYVDQMHELPLEYLDIFQSIFTTFEHDMIYSFSIGLIKECLESGTKTDRVVAMTILNFLASNLPNKVYVDSALIAQLLTESLSSDDDLILQAGCNLASSYLFGIATNLISRDEIVPKLAPLLVHQSQDVRNAANQSLQQLLRGIRCPIPGISLMFFNLITEMPVNDIFSYLLLLSKCIKCDSYLKDELAEHLANFTLTMLNYDVNTDPFNSKLMVGGSCDVALSLMMMNQTTHHILAAKTIENITLLLRLPQIPSCFAFALYLLRSLMKVAPDEATQLYTAFAEQTSAFLEINENDFDLEKRNGVIYLSKIESLIDSSNHLFAQQLLEIATQWMVSDIPSYAGSGITAIKKLLPILSEQSKLEICKNLNLILQNSKEKDVVIVCSQALSKFLTESNNETLIEMAKLGYETILAFMKGEMQILNNVPPIGNDIDLMILRALSTLVSKLFRVPCDEIRLIVQFAFAVIEQNKHNFETAIIFITLASGIENNCFIQEEIEKTIQLALSFLIDDIPIELMYFEASLLIQLVDKNLLGWDLIETKFSTIENWWNQCCTNQNKMKTAQAQLVILIWKIAYQFELGQKIPELIHKTFIQFPPDDITQTAKLILLAKQLWEGGIFDHETVMPLFAKRITVLKF